MIEFRTLGAIDLRDPANEDLPSILARPKLVGLLTYLALARPKGYRHRDSLVGLFWPESSQDKARRSLNQALYQLRKGLGDGVVLSQGDEEVAVDGSRLWCDAQEFETSGDRATTLRLYQGELLPGFSLPGCEEFDIWLEERRSELRERALRAMREHAEELSSEGNRVEATFWLRRALLLEPYDEDLLRRLLEHLLALGDRTGALREYRTFARRLAEDLQVEPSSEISTIIEAARINGAPRKQPERAGVSEVEALRVGEGAPSPDVIRRPPPARRWGMITALLFAGVLLAVISGRERPEAIAGPHLMPNRVLVAPFENRTGDPALDPLGPLAMEWIAQELTRTGLVRAVLPVGAHAAGDRTPSILEAAGDARAAIAVVGSFYLEADSFAFQVQVIDVASGEIAHGIEGIRGVRENPAQALGRLRQRTTGALATLIDSRLATWARSASQPPSFRAYRRYREGLDLYARGEYRAATAAFHEAAIDDSMFTSPLIWQVLAHKAVMYENQVHLDFQQGEKADSILQHLELRRDRLAPWDRAMLDYQISWSRSDLRSAHDAVREVVELAPDSEWQLRLAEVALWRNDVGEVLDALAQIDPEEAERRGWWDRWRLLSYALHRVGRYEEELKVLRDWQARAPQDPRARAAEIGALAGLGRSVEVEEHLQRLIESLPPEQLPFHVRELQIHGLDELANEALDLVVRELMSRSPDERDEAWRFSLAGALYAAGRWDEARRQYERLIAETSISDNHLWYLGYLGRLAAKRGDRRAALMYARQLQDPKYRAFAVDFSIDVSVWQRAQITALLGDREEAVAILREGFGLRSGESMPHPSRHPELHFADLAALRGFQPYEDLVRPLLRPSPD